MYSPLPVSVRIWCYGPILADLLKATLCLIFPKEQSLLYGISSLSKLIIFFLTEFSSISSLLLLVSIIFYFSFFLNSIKVTEDHCRGEVLVPSCLILSTLYFYSYPHRKDAQGQESTKKESPYSTWNFRLPRVMLCYSCYCFSVKPEISSHSSKSYANLPCIKINSFLYVKRILEQYYLQCLTIKFHKNNM